MGLPPPSRRLSPRVIVPFWHIRRMKTGCCAAKKVLVRSGACFGAQQNNFWCATKCLAVRTSAESCLLQSSEFWSVPAWTLVYVTYVP